MKLIISPEPTDFEGSDGGPLPPSSVKESFWSAMRKFASRMPGEGVYLTDDEIKGVVDEMNKYLHLTPLVGGKP